MQYKKVFDQDFINQLPTPAMLPIPSVVALCKSNEPSEEVLRAQIEKWFQNLPEDQKADMYGRLRSLDDEQHLSAFYELLFHQYCLEEGWSIQKHPSINKQNPDFLVEVTNQGSFFLEVITLMEKEGSRQNKKRVNGLLRKFDAINKTNFHLTVQFMKCPDENIKYKALARNVENWLRTLEQEENAHKIEINEFGFNGSISAFYSEDKTPSGYISPVENGNTMVDQVKTAISEKVKKYKFTKTSNKPFVIAICSSSIFSPDKWAIETALFGYEVISLEKTTLKLKKVYRDYSGLLTPNPGLGGQSRNTRISAVIFCTTVWDKEKPPQYYMRVYHNPWAETPLPFGIFKKCPQLSKIGEDSEYISLGWHNDNKQYIILNDNLLLHPPRNECSTSS
ncbi:MAG: hypothetical protein HYW14_06250 [Planctomycetes bacterium]|nr:hypothetical protein [Planctomycetota bacterium]